MCENSCKMDDDTIDKFTSQCMSLFYLLSVINFKLHHWKLVFLLEF